MDQFPYVVTLGGRIISSPLPSVEDATKEAKGWLASRGRDTAKLVIRPLILGTIGGMGDAVCTVTRRKAYGPISVSPEAR